MPCVSSSLLWSTSPLIKSAKPSALGSLEIFAVKTEIFASPCILHIQNPLLDKAQMFLLRTGCYHITKNFGECLGSASFLWRRCKTCVLGNTFPKPDQKKKKKIAKTWYIINYNYQLPHHFIPFSFQSCQEQKELHSVKALRQENGEDYFVFKQFTFQGTGAEPLRPKIMVNHIPFIQLYFGLGFSPELAYNIPFPWTALVLAALNTFLPTILLFPFLFPSGFFRSLVLIFSSVALCLPYCPFCVPLCPLHK